MAGLPLCRLQSYKPPFHHTACDYFGPIKVKIGRNKTAKHYGVIFTCLNARAVHCELATDASTIDFLQALQRFLSYRGYPKLMISDNGSQMVGAERELHDVIKGWDSNQLKELLCWQGDEMAVHHALSPSPKWLLRDYCEDYEVGITKSNSRSYFDANGVVHIFLKWANLLNQWPNWKVIRRSWRRHVFMPKWYSSRKSSTVPKGPFRETSNPCHWFEFCQKIVDSFWKKWSRDVSPPPGSQKEVEHKQTQCQCWRFRHCPWPQCHQRKMDERKSKFFPGQDGLMRNVKSENRNRKLHVSHYQNLCYPSSRRLLRLWMENYHFSLRREEGGIFCI